jgi:hypothetical protein
MNKPPPKICRRCDDRVAVRGEKYCSDCRKEVLGELEAAGYLTNIKPAVLKIREQLDRRALSTNALGGSAEVQKDDLDG